MRRNKQSKYNIDPKYILMLCVLICLGLIFFSYKFKATFEPIKTGLNSMLVPMQKGITLVGQGISNIADAFEDKQALQDENEKLKQEILELKNQNNLLQQDLYDFERYKQLLELDETYSEYKKVGANVIAKDSSGYFAVFTLDKGSDDGLQVDMNVIADTGLVGIITEVGKNYSIVRSIIDDNSYVSATIQKTNDNCIVCGNLTLLNSGFIELLDISINSDVRNNYKVYTSDLSEKYLPGILIGYVSNIQAETDGLSKKGYLTPVVDFEHLNTVLVITDLKKSPTEQDDNP